jgi:hypothetical protein
MLQGQAVNTVTHNSQWCTFEDTEKGKIPESAFCVCCEKARVGTAEKAEAAVGTEKQVKNGSNPMLQRNDKSVKRPSHVVCTLK